MGDAGCGGMNAIVFQLKRAHRASVRACRWLIEAVEGMTPARFDILMLLRNAGLMSELGGNEVNACFMSQGSMIRELGLHRSTVSEALATLEKMGWIDRCRDYDDGRHNLVGLTALGMRRFRLACFILFTRKVLKRPVDRLVRWLEPQLPFNLAFERVWETLNAIARYFGDLADFDFYDRQNGYRDEDEDEDEDEDVYEWIDPAGYLRDAIIEAHMTLRGDGSCADVLGFAQRYRALARWRCVRRRRGRS